MIAGLYIALPSQSTQTVWKCAKFQASAVSGQILVSAQAPFRNLNLEWGWYRITKIRFSANWAQNDYQRIIADNSLETPLTTWGSIVDQYGRDVLDDQLDLTEYFELDWPKYWNNTQKQNNLFFKARVNLVPDPEILQQYGDVIEMRMFIQLQHFTNQHWIDAIREEKI